VGGLNSKRPAGLGTLFSVKFRTPLLPLVELHRPMSITLRVGFEEYSRLPMQPTGAQVWLALGGEENTTTAVL
jgi:hypothetical protein